MEMEMENERKPQAISFTNGNKLTTILSGIKTTLMGFIL
jgi:hypothetical protein